MWVDVNNRAGIHYIINYYAKTRPSQLQLQNLLNEEAAAIAGLMTAVRRV